MPSLYLSWLCTSFLFTASILANPASNLRVHRCGLHNRTTGITIKNDADNGNVSRKFPVDDSYEKLLERLRWFLGRAGSANLTDSRKEIEFSDVSGLNAVRRMNMNADIPKKLLDEVGPQVAERYMELMVRIAENPSEWPPIHKALGFVDGRRRREKRSAFEAKHHHHHNHLKKPKKKRRHRIVASVRSAAHKTRRKLMKKLKSQHRGKHYYGRYRINVTEPFQKTRFRHHSAPRYGVYNADSLASLLEMPFQPKDTDEDKHFERWKVKAGWAALRNGSLNYHSKIHELRRWGLLKQHEDWLKLNVIRENEEGKPKVNPNKVTTSSETRLKEKATLLATNNWPSAQTDRLPKFSFHRVNASSPNLLNRSQKRQLSAYVAVSLIPINETKTGLPEPKPPTETSTVSSYAWPDLFDQLFLVNSERIVLNSTSGSDKH